MNDWLQANLDGEVIPVEVDECEEYLEKTTELFNNPVDLLSFQEKADDGEGMTRADMIIGSITMNMDTILFNESVNLDLRIEAINSIFNLFEGYFQYLENGSFSSMMFWDSVLSSQDASNMPQELKGAILQVLEQIVNIPAASCQVSALHGLAVFPRTDIGEIINTFLESPDVVPEAEGLAKGMRE